MFLIASKMILCLIIAFILGAIVGYLLCKLCPKSCCGTKEDDCCSKDTQESNSCCSTQESNTTISTLKSQDDVEVTKEAEVQMSKPTSVSKDDITPDNLKKIKGVGEKLEQSLNELGVYTFSQIAAWDRQNVAWVDEHLVFKGRIDRENWIEQAKTLAKGEDTEFSKKFND